MPVSTHLLALAALAALFVAGCSGRPRPPDAPELSADEAAAKAMQQYDKNADGLLDAEELKQSPPLTVALPRLDKDADGQVSAAEIAQRIQYWQNSGTIIMDGSTDVTLDGQPVEGAQVVFEPESFLGSAFKQCAGTTNAQGRANIAGPDAKFPGIYLGFYRVRITKPINGHEAIPAKYNTATELGWEQADDLPNVSNVIRFDLQSR